MEPSSENRQLGEYILQKRIGENDVSRTWLAEQVSVARRVLLDELREDRLQLRDSFLADIRVKASVDHPLIGSVYEAVAEPGLCFYAHELLPGITLAERQSASMPLSPERLCHVLRHVADANVQYEALAHATSALSLDCIHLDEQGVVRLKNLAIAGTRTPDQSARDIVHLGAALLPLIGAGQPGATRLQTLFAWMRGDGLDEPIGWQQIRDFTEQIEHQLAEAVPATRTLQATRRPRKFPVGIVLATVAALIVIAAVVAISTHKPAAPAPPRAALPDAILIDGGKYPTPDGMEEDLSAFRISANEVTIGQYADFCDTLTTLTKDNRQHTFDHDDQPKDKVSHEPDDWAALFSAAKSNGTWHDQPVTLDSPVVGVDWWDATAYVEWKQARLPTQEEWFAALRKNLEVPTSIVPAGWIPVTANATDRTPSGLIGMAGSVCEWTGRPAINPVNPLGDRLWLIIGGSYLKPGSNALTREWTANRSLRRRDLGFRIAFEVVN